ncbi:DUF3630 family protein [Oceanimonas sp. CHS3-5]|uniref:DUF3630 family protein n=1 Tax=Oceanimonas sp. CHS3-5 TaxID=3068186 RepID=UPI00273E1FF3|nr:DUF3630 family protein [Oceanimonas sp. CHS3-5]MDP5292959.1 DUF3630 family protein [Oceanimonas sp. CHS3-5]
MMTPLKSQSPLTIEAFPDWATALVQALELTVLEREAGADYHQWLVDFESSRLFLCFQHYADCAWLEALSGQDEEVAAWLTDQWNQG